MAEDLDVGMLFCVSQEERGDREEGLGLEGEVRTSSVLYCNDESAAMVTWDPCGDFKACLTEEHLESYFQCLEF